MYYAQLTGSVVTAVTQTAGPVFSADMIQISFLDLSLLGATWDGAAFHRV